MVEASGGIWGEMYGLASSPSPPLWVVAWNYLSPIKPPPRASNVILRTLAIE